VSKDQILYVDLYPDPDRDVVADANAVAVAFLDARRVQSLRVKDGPTDPQAHQSRCV
jgi:hypothetical protein